MRYNIANTNTHLNDLVNERTKKIENALLEVKRKRGSIRRIQQKSSFS